MAVKGAVNAAGRDPATGRFTKGYAGRKTGSRNKKPAEIKALAASYAREAVEKLARLMRSANDERVQFHAAQELLNRAFGKPRQELDVQASVDLGGDGVRTIADLMKRAAEGE